MSGLHLQSRRGTTAEHPGQGTAYRDGANLARNCGAAKRIFGRPSGSKNPGGLRIWGTGEDLVAHHASALSRANIPARASFKSNNEKAERCAARPRSSPIPAIWKTAVSGSRSACRRGPDEPAQAAKFALGSRLLRRKHVVPCDLHGVCRIEYVKHRDVLPFVWFPNERRLPSFACSMPIPHYGMLRTRRGVSHFKCRNRFCAVF